MPGSRHVTFESPVKEQSSALCDISNRWGCFMCLKQANMMFYSNFIKWQHSTAFALLDCRQSSPARQGHSKLPMVNMPSAAHTL